MSHFRRLLAQRNPDPAGRRWIYVPYDQCTSSVGPLSREDARTLGIVLIENPWKAALRPYHKQKLALVIANLRHFALEQAARGVAVRHVVADGPYRSALTPLLEELGPLRVMRPAERELRIDIQDTPGLQEIPHEGWLSTSQDFLTSHPNGSPWLLERFYRYMRNKTGVLMSEGKPVGGKYNYDAENRLPWKGQPPAPSPLSFPSDPIKEEVIELIATKYGKHPGTLDGDSLPATLTDAERLWEWAKLQCLPHFGDFEDAMSVRSTGLFHTRVSPLINLLRLLPQRIVNDVAAIDMPLAGKEGFIRQVLGWREFMHHIHEQTDGFRSLPEPPSALSTAEPLPPAFWGVPSGLHCLDTVVADVWREGWSHHITRLMILSNIANLLDASPRELTDWFWEAYIDAYDWVVEPNVLGLGTFSTGKLFTTKPYVSGANYINKMSDYCRSCQFDPAKNCPISPLYWAFLQRHSDVLASNPRLFMPYNNMRKRQVTQDVFVKISAKLAKGERLSPPLLSGRKKPG